MTKADRPDTAALRALLEKNRSPLPWFFLAGSILATDKHRHVVIGNELLVRDGDNLLVEARTNPRPDIDFLLTAVNALPGLLDYVEALQAELAEAKIHALMKWQKDGQGALREAHEYLRHALKLGVSKHGYESTENGNTLWAYAKTLHDKHVAVCSLGDALAEAVEKYEALADTNLTGNELAVETNRRNREMRNALAAWREQA